MPAPTRKSPPPLRSKSLAVSSRTHARTLERLARSEAAGLSPQEREDIARIAGFLRDLGRAVSALGQPVRAATFDAQAGCGRPSACNTPAFHRI